MNFRRSLAAGTLALTTVVVAGPLAANASAQTDTTSPPVANNLNCRRIVKQVRNVTRRLGRAQARLAFWQRVAAEMPARIEAQQAKVADLQAQLAAATGDAADQLQDQLDDATERLEWMQSKLEASGRRIPVWTDAVARLTALQAALGEQATAGECPAPSTTTTTVETDDSSTSSTVVADDRDGEDEDGPESTVEDRTAAERLAEAQRRNAERLAEAQRRNAERLAEAQRRAAERLAEAQKRAAESQRRTRESERRSRTTTSAPTPTVEDRQGDSGSEQDDD